MKSIVLLTVLCFFSFETPQVNGNLLTTYYYANAYYRQYVYRIVTYRRYRYYEMNRLKLRARLYTFSSLGSAFYYHNMYSTAARIVGYRIVTTYEFTRKCANFDTNPYGDFLGYFQCPLFFEPSNFTYCCGDSDFNYCCPDQSKNNPVIVVTPDITDAATIIGISVGVIVGIFIIGLIITLICCCCCKTTQSRGTVRGRGRVAVIHTNPTMQMTQPPVYPVAPPAYPTQATISVFAYTNQPMAQGGPYPAQPPTYSSAMNSYPPANSVYPPVDAAYPPPEPVLSSPNPPGVGGLPPVQPR